MPFENTSKMSEQTKTRRPLPSDRTHVEVWVGADGVARYSSEKPKSIIVRVPVRTYYETEISYDDFWNKWRPEKKEGQSEGEYREMVLRAWNDLLGQCDKVDTDEELNVLELEEIDEVECYNHGVDPLESYGPARDEWEQLVKASTEDEDEEEYDEEHVRQENERVIAVLKSMGAVEKKQ